jgi:hypothetical protein
VKPIGSVVPVMYEPEGWVDRNNEGKKGKKKIDGTDL